MAQMVKNLSANTGDLGLIPGSERSSGEGNVYSLQYSFLKKYMGGRAWRATVQGLTRDSESTE